MSMGTSGFIQRTHVLLMSSGSCCAMHFAEAVTKLPPLAQRHAFMTSYVSPVHRDWLEALFRH